MHVCVCVYMCIHIHHTYIQTAAFTAACTYACVCMCVYVYRYSSYIHTKNSLHRSTHRLRQAPMRRGARSMYARMHVCACVHVYICMTHTAVFTAAHPDFNDLPRVVVHACVHVRTSVYVCMRVSIHNTKTHTATLIAAHPDFNELPRVVVHTCMHVRTHVCVCKYMYVFIIRKKIKQKKNIYTKNVCANMCMYSSFVHKYSGLHNSTPRLQRAAVRHGARMCTCTHVCVYV